MALSTRLLKTKMKSVASTRKITRAMEMVAASKMKKAVGSALATRSYFRMALSMLIELTREKHTEPHPYVVRGKGDSVLVIVLAADRGLCGGFHTNLERFARVKLANHNGSEIRYITVGKNAERIVRRASGGKDINIVGSFVSLPETITTEALGGLTQLVKDEYEKGEYKKVEILYTRYHSAMKQEARMDNLLPLLSAELLELYNDLAQAGHKHEFRLRDLSGYQFEPDINAVMKVVLPRLLEACVYQYVLESRASEQSARMVAMKQASDNAAELLDDLSLRFNRARQESVTREIAEIAGGAEALRAA